MGLWRQDDHDDGTGTGGVLGALGCMLGLYLIAGLVRAHIEATRQRAARTSHPGLGWWTLGLLLVTLAALVWAT